MKERERRVGNEKGNKWVWVGEFLSELSEYIMDVGKESEEMREKIRTKVVRDGWMKDEGGRGSGRQKHIRSK